MSLGKAEVTKANFADAIAARRARIEAAYERGRSVAEQTLESLCPEDSGALKRSSEAKPLTGELIGFVMRSFGNEESGKAYAKWVNGGHHVKKKDGTVVFVAAVPYYSQAESDARAALAEAFRQR